MSSQERSKLDETNVMNGIQYLYPITIVVGLILVVIIVITYYVVKESATVRVIKQWTIFDFKRPTPRPSNVEPSLCNQPNHTEKSENYSQILEQGAPGHMQRSRTQQFIAQLRLREPLSQNVTIEKPDHSQPRGDLPELRKKLSI